MNKEPNQESQNAISLPKTKKELIMLLSDFYISLGRVSRKMHTDKEVAKESAKNFLKNHSKLTKKQ